MLGAPPRVRFRIHPEFPIGPLPGQSASSRPPVNPDLLSPAAPAFPLISHFDGRMLSAGLEAWDEGLASVALPVDWLAVVARLRVLGSPLAECGYGTQLAGLTRWAERSFLVSSLQAQPQQV